MSKSMRRKLSKDERATIYNLYGGHCAYCGQEITIDQMQVDHIKAFSLGGEDSIDNLLPACRSCNHYKHSLSLEAFREQIERLPEVLNQNSVSYRIAVRYGLIEPKEKDVVFYCEKRKDRM